MPKKKIKVKIIDDYEVMKFVDVSLREINKSRRINKAWWTSVTSLIVFLNLTTIVLAALAMYYTISFHDKRESNESLLHDVGFTITTALLVMLHFAGTLVVVYIRVNSRAIQFKEAADDIQYLTILYKQQIKRYAKNDRDKLFKSDIQKIVKLSKGRKLPFKQKLKKVFYEGAENV